VRERERHARNVEQDSETGSPYTRAILLDSNLHAIVLCTYRCLLSSSYWNGSGKAKEREMDERDEPFTLGVPQFRIGCNSCKSSSQCLYAEEEAWIREISERRKKGDFEVDSEENVSGGYLRASLGILTFKILQI
jgi:hypothetical protein